MQRSFSAQIPRRIRAAWAMARQARVRDRNLHVFGGAALLRRPKVQGRAAALPYQEGEDLCYAPGRL
jgi:hypothetical protein